MVSIPERRREQYWAVYNLLNETPRIDCKAIGKALGLDRKTATRILTEALEQGYIVGPHLRKKSYRNFPEYVYFLKAPERIDLYERFKKNDRVTYHAKVIGFSDVWAVAKTSLDLYPECEVVAQGRRSDYLLSHALNCSWDDSFSTMKNMIRDFDPSTYSMKNYLQTHWNETTEWSDTDEILFQEMKYDLRKALEPLLKEKYHIGCGSAYEWLRKLCNYCTIATSYFPEGISAYDPYLFMFETEYEDFIVDLFSQLPVSTFFFRVDNKLILYIHVKKEFLRGAGKNGIELDKLQIPLSIEELQNRKIITSSSYGIVEYCWGKDF
jgi:hypothetical protein